VGGEGEELNGEVARPGAEDEAALVEVDETEEEGGSTADGVESGLVGAVGGEGVVVAIEDGDGAGGDERVHGGGLLGICPDGEEALPVGVAGVAGWLTTAGSKPGMVSRMGALLVESPWLFFSRRLLGECRTFVAMAGGRTGAVNGAHDDCLMAMAIGQAVRAELVARRR
jgi:hypothetical protein